jgi:GAF domain-containing protein
VELQIPYDCIAVYTRAGVSIRAQYMNGSCECAFSSRMIPLGQGLSGWVTENARCIVNGNPTVEPNFVPEAGLFTLESSALAVPLFSANGVSFGAVTLYAREPAAFSKGHRQMLEEMMPEFAIALGNATRMDEHAAEETLAFDADAGPVLEGARAS